MFFKRNEAFRFVFDQPQQGTLKKLQQTNSVTVNIHLLDISNYGAKITMSNRIDLQTDQQIYLSFMLNSTKFQAHGKVSWTRILGNSIQAGLHLNTDELYRENLIIVLKKIAKDKL